MMLGQPENTNIDIIECVETVMKKKQRQIVTQFFFLPT